MRKAIYAIRHHLGSRVFLKYFLLFFLCFTIPASALGSLLFLGMRDNVRNEIQQDYKYSFEHACDTLDAELFDLQNAAFTISTIRWVQSFLAMPSGTLRASSTPSTRLSALKSVKNITALISSIDGLAICFPSQDAVFSNLWYDSLNDYFAVDMVYPNLTPDDWREILAGRNEMRILPDTMVQRLGMGRGAYITVVQTLSPNGGWEDGAALFFISREHFTNMFAQILQGNGALQINDSSTILLSINENAADRGGFTYFRSLPLSGWTVCCTVPYSVASAQLGILLRYTGILALVLFFAMLMLAYLFAAQNYKPVYAVTREISGAKEDTTPSGGARRDEFDYVIKQWRGVNERMRFYQKHMLDYYSLAKRHCVHLLVESSADAAQSAKETLTIIGTSFSHPCFRCVLLFKIEQLLLPEALDRILSSATCSVLSAQIGENTVICCNYVSDEDFSAFADKLNSILSDNCLADVSIVAGTQQSAEGGFAQSYFEAGRAVDAQILHSLTPTIGWSYAAPLLNVDMHVSFEVSEEERLIDLLKIGDGLAATSLACSILERNYALPGQTLRYLYHLLLVLPFRILDDSVTSVGKASLAKAEAADSIDTMRDRIINLYRSICDVQQASIQSFRDDISDWIAQFAEENKYNPDLSLKKIGDEFNLSVSQVSRLFKLRMGVGFAEWISSERIKYAKHLLLDMPQFTIAQVAQQCGFTNEVSFHRAFKKGTDITPGEFRKAYYQ